jgi:hypothetical protein
MLRLLEQERTDDECGARDAYRINGSLAKISRLYNQLCRVGDPYHYRFWPKNYLQHNRKFTRLTNDATLKPHKDKQGMPCYGTYGVYVDTIY